MHYGLAHWIEDETECKKTPGKGGGYATCAGDGAFSSAGSKGWYPWIDATNTYYGLIARVAAKGGNGYASLQCGRLLRYAFLNGVPQYGPSPTATGAAP